jgi:ABC transporter substrate binding protein (PQQ-dependent alcohol dehydrogenase system)
MPSSRRLFLRRLLAAGAGLATCPARRLLALAPASPGAQPAGTTDTIRVGHLTVGTTPAAATRARQGATWAADEATYNAELFGRTVRFATRGADTPDEVAEAARTLLDQQGGLELLVVGTAGALAPEILEMADAEGVLVVNAGEHDTAWRNARCHPRLVHVQASDAMLADALTQWAVEERSLRRWAILEGTSARDQALAARLRQRLEAMGGAVVATVAAEAPGPAVQQAAGTGAEALAVAVTGDAQIPLVGALMDAEAAVPVLGPVLDPYWPTAERPLTVGAWPVLWHPALFKYGATQLSDRYAGRFGQDMEGLAWTNWAAVTFAVEAVLRAGTTAPDALADYLVGQGRFDSRKGVPLTFRPWNQQARQVLYIAEAQPDGTLALAGEVPGALRGAPEAVTARLDALGLSADASACTLG